MKRLRLLAILLVLGAIGYAVVANQNPQVNRSQQRLIRRATAPFRPRRRIPAIERRKPPVLQPERLKASANNPALFRDYEPMTPIPAIDRVTIRDDVRNLAPDQAIADCPTDTSVYAFAESTSYFVQICSQEQDPWLPKYYIGQAKDGSSEQQITSDNPDEARQLIFRDQGYAYILYRDSARPDLTNAYLEIYTPEGTVYAEALLYFYERLDQNDQAP